MSIGILIITHSGIGSALLETATSMLGVCPLDTETLAVTPDSDPDLLLKQAQGMVDDLDQGDGVLVLTDMFGSTPSNIATRLRRPGRVAVVAGINLPMLVRVLNYPTLDLQALVDTAVSGGNRGVLCCRRPDKRGAGTA